MRKPSISPAKLGYLHVSGDKTKARVRPGGGPRVSELEQNRDLSSASSVPQLTHSGPRAILFFFFDKK